MENGGLPIVLNPALPKNADMLIVQLEGSSKKLEVDIGKIKINELNFGEEAQQKVQVSTRKSGSCWVIEFFSNTAAFIFDDKLA